MTVAADPGERVDVVPTETVAAEPAAPVAPVLPAGIPKLKIAAEEDPAFVTVADEPGDNVVVVPAAIVAAAPFVPLVPFVPGAPVAPVKPEGIPKLKIAADEDPTLLTVAEDPGDNVVVDPAAIVAAAPLVPLVPLVPLIPAGIPKLKIAFEDVPEFDTVALEPPDKVFVVPTAMVAALPFVPFVPGDPVAPVAPAGIPKLKIADEELPTLETVAEKPGDKVVVDPTATVAAVPFVPLVPLVPFVPFVPLTPAGIAKSKIAAELVPEFVTLADEPGDKVVVDPAAIVAAEPFVPAAPVSPVGIPKLKIAAELLPLLETVALDPGSKFVVVPTPIVAALPFVPLVPGAPVNPEGIPKLKIAAEDDPTFVTLADEPGDKVVVDPAAIVAALPFVPLLPGDPVSPLGIAKSKIAAEELPELLTVGVEPGGKLLVVPTVIVAAFPLRPLSPFVPFVPLVPFVPGDPVSPEGMEKLKIADEGDPTLATEAREPGGKVFVVPTAIVAAVPAGP